MMRVFELITSMSSHPESFPVNTLVPIEGTPLENNDVSSFCRELPDEY
jgi:biotin synthase-like enzyme